MHLSENQSDSRVSGRKGYLHSGSNNFSEGRKSIIFHYRQTIENNNDTLLKKGLHSALFVPLILDGRIMNTMTLGHLNRESIRYIGIEEGYPSIKLLFCVKGL